nr:MAG TPA: hypothetical protein [Caudoviricetes sp.]
MRYFYEKPETFRRTRGFTYTCSAQLYSKCTLYKQGDKGLGVIQQRFNPKLKIFWWGPVDPWLVDDVANADGFESYFNALGGLPVDGVYPTVTIRSCMYALRMKPLKKQWWEEKRKVYAE